MSEKLNMKIKVEVEGKEGMDITVEYKGTDIKTVCMVEKAIMGAFAGLIDGQLAG